MLISTNSTRGSILGIRGQLKGLVWPLPHFTLTQLYAGRNTRIDSAYSAVTAIIDTTFTPHFHLTPIPSVMI